ALSPAELVVAGQERWLIAAAWLQDVAAVNALFAAPFVLIFGTIAEIFAIRSFAYYAIGGVFVALAGFAVLLAGEPPDAATVANSYAVAAYLSAGFLGGIAYWLVAGRYAGGRRGRRKRSAPDEAAATDRDHVKPGAKSDIPVAAKSSEAAASSSGSGKAKAPAPQGARDAGTRSSTGSVPVTRTAAKPA
ncbi:MAG: hypothetical protein AAFV26_05710, partial [Pseudomonadota bacterium]